MSGGHTGDATPGSARIEQTATTLEGASAVTMRRLQLCFATLCVLGGVVLAGNEETQTLPYVAIFFAVFGYVFVDWLQLFALPPILAYFGMAGVAIYCVGNFWNWDAPGNTQMVSVANLLVMVQSILMLQQKTPRIFEQLTVFCLLQLVVAAVFNHALSYGLLLVPISLLMATGLALLSALSVDDRAQNYGVGPLLRRPPSPLRRHVSFSGSESFQHAIGSASRVPRAVMLSAVPAVILIGAMFFYALPRTTDAARPSSEGQALVGFSDSLSLDQIGLMHQSGQVALRVSMTDTDTSLPYIARDGIYLRGRVLDKYDDGISQRTGFGRRAFRRSGRVVTTWKSSDKDDVGASGRLPREYIPSQRSDRNFYDAVEVNITCHSIRSPALFAIAPYFHMGTGQDVVHDRRRWTLSRTERDSLVFPRMHYQFLTHGFRNGVQSKILSRPPVAEEIAASNALATEPPADGLIEGVATAESEKTDESDPLLEINRARLPTIVSVAERIAGEIPERNRTPMRIARRIETHLSTSPDYRYTLRLDRPFVPRTDPIEQFMSIDKEGHCQLFASAMAMMLRSQGIPARIVVGYRTSEYNELGPYYIARQLHAHAWVEALINQQHIGPTNNVYGQPRTNDYWVRFDPTPTASLSSGDGGGVSQVLDLAQNLWDDYVVDMDGQRQNGTLAGGESDSTMFASYTSFFRWVDMRIAGIRAGQLGGGSLAGRPSFSWPAAIVTIFLGVLAFLISRVPFRYWLRRRSRKHDDEGHQHPRFRFYRQTLDELRRLGIERRPNQTPVEFASMAADDQTNPRRGALGQPLDVLTSAYNRFRYGYDAGRPDLRDGKASQEEDFGSSIIVGPEKQQIETALANLSKQIDQIMLQDNGAPAPPQERQ